MRAALAALAALAPAAAFAAGPGGGAAAPPPGATTCSGCHAPAGSSGFMPIDGRDSASLMATMNGYRSGAIPSTLMGRLMKGFSPEEIQAIAAWISAQK